MRYFERIWSRNCPGKFKVRCNLAKSVPEMSRYFLVSHIFGHFVIIFKSVPELSRIPGPFSGH